MESGPNHDSRNTHRVPCQTGREDAIGITARTQPDGLEFTILMPCLNEAASVGFCVNEAVTYLRSRSISGEVLVVDNGSADDSAGLAEAAGARVVRESRRGYGSALLRGIAEARGQYIIMADADGEYNFSELDGFVSLLRDGYEFVCGDRYAGQTQESASPFLNRYIGVPALSMAGRLLFGIKTKDFHCGLRGFSAGSVRALGLRSTGMEFASEMVIAFARSGAKVAEVPVNKRRAYDPARRPHLRVWRDGFRHLFLIFKMRAGRA